LPNYRVPAQITVLKRLPQTSSGKIDRTALPAADDDDVSEDSSVAAAPSETERILQTVWTSLLGVRRPGVDATFFELGGHSLLATRLVARVRQLLDVELPLRAV